MIGALLFFLGALPFVQEPRVDVENLRIVQYYDSRFYASAEPPFTLSPSQVLPLEAITEDGIEAALTGRNLLIEVCTYIRDSEDAPWRVPSTLAERERACERHGSYEPERRP